MGQFTSSRRLPLVDQAVYVNGALDERIWCENISRGSGCGSTMAAFSVPELLYDSYAADLTDALVQVYVFGQGLSQNSNPDFVGYLMFDSSEVSPVEDRKTFSARSITSLLNRVEVGQNADPPRPVVGYTLVDPVTRRKTQWKPLRILQDIFGSGGPSSPSGGMPSYYRVRVALGDTSVLSDTSDITALSFDFNLMKYDGAVDYILAAYGDVAVKERFVGSKCYLDFYRIQAPENGIVYARLSQFDDPKTTGAIVQSLTRQGSSAETITRIQGFGQPLLLMMSAKSYVEALTAQSQATESKRLIRDWDAKWEEIVKGNPKLVTSEKSQMTLLASPTFTPASPVDITSGVTSFAVGGPAADADNKRPPYAVPVGSVLLNPKTSEQMLVTAYTHGALITNTGTVTVTRGYNSTTAATIVADTQLEWHMPGIEFVFRRYRLPACLNPLKKRRENAKRRTDEVTEYPVQVWSYRASKDEDTDEENTNITAGTISTVPTLLEGAQIDLEHNRFTLNKVALEEVAMAPSETDGDATARTFVETVVGITFTVEASEYLCYDTGAPVVRTTGLDVDQDGLIDRFKRDELYFAQFTSDGFPVKDEDDAEQTFGCVYFDLDDNNKLIQHALDAAVTIHDDTKTLRRQCEDMLREKNQRARAYNTILPTFTRGYDIGQQLYVSGENYYEYSGDKITSVELNMPINGDHSTAITTDNVKPPVRRKARVSPTGGHHGRPANAPTRPAVSAPHRAAASPAAASAITPAASTQRSGPANITAEGTLAMTNVMPDGSIREFASAWT